MTRQQRPYVEQLHQFAHILPSLPLTTIMATQHVIHVVERGDAHHHLHVPSAHATGQQIQSILMERHPVHIAQVQQDIGVEQQPHHGSPALRRRSCSTISSSDQSPSTAGSSALANISMIASLRSISRLRTKSNVICSNSGSSPVSAR
ncbi:hypothetical protein BSAE_1853 [Bifidobacterium pullorum subsp. saeculare DSM 6531 = LMG 14934]|uniref:Uncharacterized protein n=1 Tax=Bifidobacterium pullorum subsp. saeculare DSM 6531 = LMG 14934 TaxID=1437611 RepID=A0A087CP61_9BIFI|nr:hypothetical protein BSAE_1853 [Bifidobacterium pullorum subsp. saeculare DSM 6531 = LMG 14934]